MIRSKRYRDGMLDDVNKYMSNKEGIVRCI